MKLHALLHDLDEWSSGDNAAFLEAPTRRKTQSTTNDLLYVSISSSSINCLCLLTLVSVVGKMLTFKIQDLVVLAKRRTADALFKWNNR